MTGSNISKILGILGVDGGANLFFLNPNGILFGNNARLDVGGSFVASTAKSFMFGDGLEFSATHPQAPPLLKIDLTPGLQYGHFDPSRTIQNTGNLAAGQDLKLLAGNLDLQGQLQAGRDLCLQGDTVKVRDSVINPFIAAAGGKLFVQGNESVEIFALNHPNSGLLSGGDMVLQSANTVGGDAYFWSGGSFRIEKLDGSLGNLFSPYDPIIRASGDVSFEEYEGASLHILAGGSVIIPGTVYASGKDNTDFLRENVTLSDGKTVVTIDGSAKPTVDIRAGTTVVGTPLGVTGSNIGFKSIPFVRSTSHSADIKIGAIYTPGEAEGLVFLSNQYRPNSASGNIQVGNIDVSTFYSLNGGTAFIDSRGDITLNDKFNPFVGNGNGGSVTLLANNNINTRDIDTLSNKGNAGAITLNAVNGNINITGYVNSGTSTTSSNAGNGGAITLNAPKGSIKIIGTLDTSSNSSFPYGRNVRDANVGNGGSVTLNAGDRIDITGLISSNTSLCCAGVSILQTGNVGNGGTVKLSALNGIKITSINSSAGNSNNHPYTQPINNNDINTIIPYITYINSIKSDITTGSGGAVTLSTSNGNIEIGSINSSATARFGNAGNGGTITLEAPNSSIKLGGLLWSKAEVSFGDSGDGGAVNIIASGDIETRITSYSSSATGNPGNGGAINLISTEGNIKTGGLSSYSLVAYTGNSGNAGEINLTAPKGSITTGDVFAFSSKSILYDYDFFPTRSERGASINLAAKEDVTTGSLISYGGSESGNITVNTTGAFSAANSIISTSTNGPGRSGDIEIRARSVTLNDGSQVSTSTPTQGKGGNVSIIAPDFVSLSGTSPKIVRLAWTRQGLFAAPGSGLSRDIKLSGYIPPLDFSRQFGEVAFPTGIYTQTSGQNSDAGNAGIINIKTGRLVVQDRAVIAATTFGSGDGGNIFIKANDVTVRNGSILSGVGLQATGNSGNIDIQSRSLNISEGGTVQTLTLGGGKAGNIEVKATDAVEISGFNSTSGLASGLLSGTEGLDSGLGGNISVITPQLHILDKAVLSARTLGSANAGDIILKVRDNITLAGKDSGLFANTELDSSGKGGNIFIDPRSMTIRDGAKIAVDSQGTGIGGNIELAAGTLTLDRGSISAQTRRNTGGNITLNLQDLLLLRNSSQISTTAGNREFGGDGGNIIINTPIIVAIPKENSDIKADAFTGKGGKVDIRTNGIFGIVPQKGSTEKSDITASSELGVSGKVTINTPDTDPSRGLIQLPSNLVDASQQIASGCTPNGGQTTSRFIATGRGGLPFSPNEPLRGRAVITDWVDLPPQATHRVTDKLSTASVTKSTNKIVEAQRWIVDANGDVILVAQSPRSSSIPSAMSCSQ